MRHSSRQVSRSKLVDEPGRLAALARCQVLDTAPEPVFDRITSLVKTIFQVPMVAISLLDSDRQWFKSKQGMCEYETPRDVSFCTTTIRSLGPMIVSDASRDPRFRDNPFVTGPPYLRSYVGIPLCTPDGYQVGVLCVLDTVVRRYDPSQIEMLEQFAGIVEAALELRLIAQSDHLTGLLSRRAFVAELASAIKLFRRSGRPSTLLMFDIDHFKAVNDNHGHNAGDLTLRAVAESCGRLIREGEVFGRIGGEEFGILLVETSLKQALLAAERFRQVIAALAIPHDPPIHVTASFGVAELSDAEYGHEEWLAAADAALYQAKQAGRNRCNAAMSPTLEVAL